MEHIRNTPQGHRPGTVGFDAYPPRQVARFVIIEAVRWTVHVGAVVGVVLTGVSWPAFAAFLVCFAIGATGTTLCYHRYFAHRCFRTSRAFQFVLALWGATSLQRGPIWWSAVHRHHHAHSDTAADWHSPRGGFWHAHMGWLGSPRILSVDASRTRDLARYPELRFLETWYHLPSAVMIAALALTGSWLQVHYPELGTSAWQMVVWGFFVKATLVWQLAFTVNSVLHRHGSQRYDTGDDSRNAPLWLALLTLGDGYHNNHHHAPAAARHGFHAGEVDLTWLLMRALERLHLVSDLRAPPRPGHPPGNPAAPSLPAAAPGTSSAGRVTASPGPRKARGPSSSASPCADPTPPA